MYEENIKYTFTKFLADIVREREKKEGKIRIIVKRYR